MDDDRSTGPLSTQRELPKDDSYTKGKVAGSPVSPTRSVPTPAPDSSWGRDKCGPAGVSRRKR